MMLELWSKVTAIAVSGMAVLASFAWLVGLILAYKTYREQAKRTIFVHELLAVVRGFQSDMKACKPHPGSPLPDPPPISYGLKEEKNLPR